MLSMLGMAVVPIASEATFPSLPWTASCAREAGKRSGRVCSVCRGGVFVPWYLLE